MDLKTPGSRLKYLRERNGLTQEELAENTDYSLSSIQKYEGNARKLSPRSAAIFADFFNVSTEYILGVPSPIPSGRGTESSYLLLLKTFAELRGISITFHGTQVIQGDYVGSWEIGSYDKEKELPSDYVPGISVPLKDVFEMDLTLACANVKCESGDIIRLNVEDVSINSDDLIPFYYFSACFFRIMRSMESEFNLMLSNYENFNYVYLENAF